MAWLGECRWHDRCCPTGWVRSLLVDGDDRRRRRGAGLFLPQIVILFFFILLLEESGYLPRAAFLLDRLMGGGRALSWALASSRCCRALPVPYPAVMAARTIANPRDRLVTILIAPLMTCSARLPVYALLDRRVHPAACELWGGFELQGLVLFVLYAWRALPWAQWRWPGCSSDSLPAGSQALA